MTKLYNERTWSTGRSFMWRPRVCWERAALARECPASHDLCGPSDNNDTIGWWNSDYYIVEPIRDERKIGHSQHACNARHAWRDPSIRSGRLVCWGRWKGMVGWLEGSRRERRLGGNSGFGTSRRGKEVKDGGVWEVPRGHYPSKS